MTMKLLWPDEFEQNITDFSAYTIPHVLAIQLCAWGNVFMQAKPPDNFFEVMDAASKLTGAFTPDQCRARCDIILNKKDTDDED